jgi:hypothetical protein
MNMQALARSSKNVGHDAHMMSRGFDIGLFHLSVVDENDSSVSITAKWRDVESNMTGVATVGFQKSLLQDRWFCQGWQLRAKAITLFEQFGEEGKPFEVVICGQQFSL